MDKNELKGLIEEKVNEIFYEYQKANGITDGGVDPYTLWEIESLETRLANIIVNLYSKEVVY